MNDKILYILALCFVAALAGRLMVSNKERSQKLSGPMYATMTLGYINYVALYEHWAIVGLGLLLAYAVGFTGKDSLKPFLRQKVRPEVKRTVGSWEQPPTSDDDHHQHGI